MSKIEIFAEQDRLTVASILVKNGYTVRQFRERVEGKRSYLYYLEYSKPKKSAGEEDERE
jgi:hypothetical protein